MSGWWDKKSQYKADNDDSDRDSDRESDESDRGNVGKRRSVAQIRDSNSDDDAESNHDSSPDDAEDEDNKIAMDKYSNIDKKDGKKKPTKIPPVRPSSNLTWGVGNVDTAMQHFKEVVVTFMQNKKKRRKLYIFSHTNSDEHLEHAQPSFMLQYAKVAHDQPISLQFVFSNKKNLARDIVAAHFQAEVKKDNGTRVSRFVEIGQSGKSIMLIRLELINANSNRPECPISINIEGITGEYTNPCCASWAMDEKPLAIIHHGAPPQILTKLSTNTDPYLYAFNGVHQIDEDKDKGARAWGAPDQYNENIRVDMDAGRFIWFGHNLPELLIEYCKDANNPTLKFIDETTLKRVSDFLDKNPVPEIYKRDVDLTTNYIGKVINVINPQTVDGDDDVSKEVATAITASKASKSKDKSSTGKNERQLVWAVSENEDTYVVPIKFMEWCHTKYIECVKGIRMISTKNLSLSAKPAPVPQGCRQYGLEDVMTFSCRSSFFSPKLMIFTTEVLHKSKKSK